MLTVCIKDLVIKAKHGVKPEEKEHAQRFVFNIELTVNDNPAGISDDLADTINYSEVKKAIIDIARNNSFNLIEKLAQTVADRLLADGRVKKVVVRIDKPNVWDNGVPGIRLEAPSN